jgi:glutamyl-Q tRNA(Asp) synthetase
MYRGRFAPSPTGPLHLGSLAAAMGSYLDAKQHKGQWLVRIEDVDTTRALPGMADEHLRTLEALGFQWDEAVLRQSHRSAVYREALLQLAQSTYRCRCTRSELLMQAQAIGQTHERGKELIYLGKCRDAALPKTAISEATPKLATRIALPNHNNVERSAKLSTMSDFDDRWLGKQHFDLRTECGDFVLQRADQIFSYQLAVVVDDHEQVITHIVRGQDLLNNTPRQRWLHDQLYGPCTWRYAHLPLVLGADGQKLSKQNGATGLDLSRPVDTLNLALVALGLLPSLAKTVDEFWREQTSAEGLQRFGLLFAPDNTLIQTKR